jgi:hypothetical protein
MFAVRYTYRAILVWDISGSKIDRNTPQIAPKAVPSKIQLRVWGRFSFIYTTLNIPYFEHRSDWVICPQVVSEHP